MIPSADAYYDKSEGIVALLEKISTMFAENKKAKVHWRTAVEFDCLVIEKTPCVLRSLPTLEIKNYF